MTSEPCARELDDPFEGSGLLEQMRRARHDFEPLLAPQVRQGRPIHLDDRQVQVADDEQGRRSDFVQRSDGQIRSPAAGDDGTDLDLAAGGGDQRGAGTGACTEIAGLQIPKPLVPQKLIRRPEEPVGQKFDIEHLAAVLSFGRRQQVEQKGAEPDLAQSFGHEIVARAETAAAAAVREKH